jgi:hypothetical protein
LVDSDLSLQVQDSLFKAEKDSHILENDRSFVKRAYNNLVIR